MEVKYCKNTLIHLFNCGILTVNSAKWFYERGYYLVCEDGRAVNLVKE